MPVVHGHGNERLTRNGTGTLCYGHITVTLRFPLKSRDLLKELVKIEKLQGSKNSEVLIKNFNAKIFQINLLGSQVNSHGIFIFLLTKYRGQLGIIAHRILRSS
jgi:hypothetical protein